MRTLNRVMEFFWLAVAAIWTVAQEGWEKGAQWFFFPAIALTMFFFRRITSRKLEAMAERQRQERTGQ
jgi:hypothetical protein